MLVYWLLWIGFAVAMAFILERIHVFKVDDRSLYYISMIAIVLLVLFLAEKGHEMFLKRTRSPSLRRILEEQEKSSECKGCRA